MRRSVRRVWCIVVRLIREIERRLIGPGMIFEGWTLVLVLAFWIVVCCCFDCWCWMDDCWCWRVGFLWCVHQWMWIVHFVLQVMLTYGLRCCCYCSASVSSFSSSLGSWLDCCRLPCYCYELSRLLLLSNAHRLVLLKWSSYSRLNNQSFDASP